MLPPQAEHPAAGVTNSSSLLGAVAAYRPLRAMHSTLPGLVGPKQRDDESMMFQCAKEEGSSLAQFQPPSCCVLGDAKIGCTAGSLEDAGL